MVRANDKKFNMGSVFVYLRLCSINAVKKYPYNIWHFYVLCGFLKMFSTKTTCFMDMLVCPRRLTFFSWGNCSFELLEIMYEPLSYFLPIIYSRLKSSAGVGYCTLQRILVFRHNLGSLITGLTLNPYQLFAVSNGSMYYWSQSMLISWKVVMMNSWWLFPCCYQHRPGRWVAVRFTTCTAYSWEHNELSTSRPVCLCSCLLVAMPIWPRQLISTSIQCIWFHWGYKYNVIVFFKWNKKRIHCSFLLCRMRK